MLQVISDVIHVILAVAIVVLSLTVKIAFRDVSARLTKRNVPITKPKDLAACAVEQTHGVSVAVDVVAGELTAQTTNPTSSIVTAENELNKTVLVTVG